MRNHGVAPRFSRSFACSLAPIVAALLAFSSARALAQDYRNLSSVQDGSGTLSTNTVNLGGINYTNVSAGGQPGGIFTSTGGTYTNYAGFLQAVDIKRPDLKDKYGNPYELTPDNDADGLSDVSEILGTNFNPATPTDPNNPDTDGTGVSDCEKAIAGVDPTNPASAFEIISVQRSSSNNVITFAARGDGVKQYKILAADGPYAIPNQILATNSYSGGVAPWYEVTAVYTNSGAASNRSYAVQVMK